MNIAGEVKLRVKTQRDKNNWCKTNLCQRQKIKYCSNMETWDKMREYKQLTSHQVENIDAKHQKHWLL
jgi:hypothetical protein